MRQVSLLVAFVGLICIASAQFVSYDVTSDCSSISCSRETYKTTFNGKTTENSIACPKAGKGIARLQYVAGSYMLQLETYNIFGSGQTVLLELKYDNGKLVLLNAKQEIKWVLTQNLKQDEILVDRSRANGNNSCNFKLLKTK